MIVVDIPSVDGKILRHMVLAVATSMIMLVRIFLSSSIFHMEQFLSLVISMHISISDMCSYSPTLLCLIWIYMSPSPSALNLLL